MWLAQHRIQNAIRYDDVSQVWLCWGQRSGKTRAIGNVGIPEFIRREEARRGNFATRVAVVSTSVEDVSSAIIKEACVALKSTGYTTFSSGEKVSRVYLPTRGGNHDLFALSYDSFLQRGYSKDLDAIFLDEADWQKDPLFVIKHAKRKLRKGGFLWVSSSPASPSGPLMSIVTAMTDIANVYASHLTTWEANPLVLRHDMERERSLNEEAFLRDFAAYKNNGL